MAALHLWVQARERRKDRHRELVRELLPIGVPRHRGCLVPNTPQNDRNCTIKYGGASAGTEAIRSVARLFGDTTTFSAHQQGQRPRPSEGRGTLRWHPEDVKTLAAKRLIDASELADLQVPRHHGDVRHTDHRAGKHHL